MQKTSPMPWLSKCGFSAAALLVACGVATAWVGKGLPLPAATVRDGTLLTLNRYVQEPVPDVVLLGSSLGFRLKEEYFATEGVRNLALAGGSPITGLEVVLHQSRLPRLVLVETNVLSRPPDENVIARYSRERGFAVELLRPIRASIAAYENWRHAPLTHAQVVAEMDRLLKEPASDFDNRIYLARAVKEFDEDPTVAVQANVERLAALIQKARERDARIMLLELPFPKEIEATRTVQITRRIMHGRFADPTRWLPIDVAPGELRWLDGVHLDERSAMLVSRSIDGAIGRLLKSD
jgi:hypothetical protein